MSAAQIDEPVVSGALRRLTSTPPGAAQYRVSVRGCDGCSWCGEYPSTGRLFLYFTTWDAADAIIRRAGLIDEDDVFCSLHCWGQSHGFVEL